MAQKIRVKCSRCDGTGRVNHVVRDGVCFCCGGAGHYFRKPATKRETEAEYLARMNAHIATLNFAS